LPPDAFPGLKKCRKC